MPRGELLTQGRLAPRRSLDPEVQYAKFRDALAQAGRAIVFSICDWGVRAPWRVGERGRQSLAHHRRYQPQLRSHFFDRIQSQNRLEKFAGPGHWHDLDRLEVGNRGMTRDEYHTHMSVSALLAAPLLAANDIRTVRNQRTADQA